MNFTELIYKTHEIKACGTTWELFATYLLHSENRLGPKHMKTYVVQRHGQEVIIPVDQHKRQVFNGPEAL